MTSSITLSFVQCYLKIYLFTFISLVAAFTVYSRLSRDNLFVVFDVRWWFNVSKIRQKSPLSATQGSILSQDTPCLPGLREKAWKANIFDFRNEHFFIVTKTTKFTGGHYKMRLLLNRNLTSKSEITPLNILCCWYSYNRFLEDILSNVCVKY